MKKLVFVVITLALIAVSAPAVIGMVMKDRMAEQFAKVQELNGIVQADIAQYDQGWFASDVVVNFKFSDEYVQRLKAATSSTGELPTLLSDFLPIEVQVKHGPIIPSEQWFFGLATTETTVAPTQGYLANFLKGTSLEHLFKSNSQINFSGVSEFTMAMPAFVADDGGAYVDFGGMQGHGEFSFASNSGNLEIGFPSMVVTAPEGGGITLEKIKIIADGRMLRDTIWLGPVSSSIEKMSGVGDPQSGAQAFSADNFFADALTELAADGEHISIAISYGFGAMTGLPEYDISDLKLGFSLNTIPLDLVVAYQEWAKSIGSLDPQSMESLEGMGEKVPKILYDYVSASPSIEIDPLTMKLNGDAVELKMRFDFDAGLLPDRASFDVANIPMWMNLVTGSGRLDIAKTLALALAEDTMNRQLASSLPAETETNSEQMQAQLREVAKVQAPTMVSTFVQQGFLAEGETNYTADIKFQSGTLTVNDKPIPLGF